MAGVSSEDGPDNNPVGSNQIKEMECKFVCLIRAITLKLQELLAHFSIHHSFTNPQLQQREPGECLSEILQLYANKKGKKFFEDNLRSIFWKENKEKFFKHQIPKLIFKDNIDISKLDISITVPILEKIPFFPTSSKELHVASSDANKIRHSNSSCSGNKVCCAKCVQCLNCSHRCYLSNLTRHIEHVRNMRNQVHMTPQEFEEVNELVKNDPNHNKSIEWNINLRELAKCTKIICATISPQGTCYRDCEKCISIDKVVNETMHDYTNLFFGNDIELQEYRKELLDFSNILNRMESAQQTIAEENKLKLDVMHSDMKEIKTEVADGIKEIKTQVEEMKTMNDKKKINDDANEASLLINENEDSTSSDEEDTDVNAEMQDKMMAYLIHQRFYADTEFGKQFISSLPGNDEWTLSVFNDNLYRYPILESASYWLHNTAEEDKLQIINEHLKRFGKDMITKEELEQNPFAGITPSSNDNFDEAKCRRKIYRKISSRITKGQQLIGHFLLRYSDLCNVYNETNKKDTIMRMLKTWEERTAALDRRWWRLKAVIQFIGINPKLIIDIDKELGVNESPSMPTTSSHPHIKMGEPLKSKLAVVRSSPQVLTYTEQQIIYKDLDVKKMQIPKNIEVITSGKFSPIQIPFEQYLKKSNCFLSEFYNVEDGMLTQSFCFPPEAMCSDSATKIASKFMTGSVLDTTMVVLSHYDIQEHFKLLDVDFHKICLDLEIDVNTIGNPNDRFLLFNLQNNSIINVRSTTADTEAEALKTLADGDVDVRLFLYLYGKQLFGSQISIINVVAAPKITDYCSNMLVLNNDGLSETNLPKKLQSLWRDCQKIVIDESKSGNGEPALMTTLISLVFSFLAVRKVKSSFIYENASSKIQSIWLTSEQLKAIFCGKCWKIVRGCYGSGKSIVGRYLLQHLVTHAIQPTDVFYIVLDRNTLLLQNLNRFCENLSQDVNFVVTCWNTDDAAKWLSEHIQEYDEHFSLSILLKTLVSIYKNEKRNFHLFVDEVDSEIIDEKEAQNLQTIFENDDNNLQDSYILFMTRSMEKERVLHEGDRQHQYSSYGFHEICGMDVINLSYSMRISRNAFEVVVAALKGITQPNTIPQPHPEANEVIETVSLESIHSERIPQPDLIAKGDSNDSIKKFTEPKHKTQQYDIEENEVDRNPTSNEQSDIKLPIKVIDPNEMEELASEYARRYEQSSSKIVCSYRFYESKGVNHNIDGKRPKMIFLNKDGIVNIVESTEELLNPIIIRCLAVALKQNCFSDTNRTDKLLIICTEPTEISLFENALTLLNESFNVYVNNKDISQAHLDASILITDHNGCRGMEYERVIVTLNPEEIFKRQCLIESMSRCTDQLILLIPYPYTETVQSNQSSSHQQSKPRRFKSVMRKFTRFFRSHGTSTADVCITAEGVGTIIESLTKSDCLDFISYSTHNSISEEFLLSKKEGTWTNWMINTNDKFNQYLSNSDLCQPREMLWGDTSERFKRNLEDVRMLKPQLDVSFHSASDDGQKKYVVKKGWKVKTLVLGAMRSGKTTFIKQMRLIHERDYDTETLMEFRPMIYANVLKEMKVLVHARQKLTINWGDPECQAYGDMLLNFQPTGEINTTTFLEYCEYVKKLWNDTGIQEVYKRRNESQLGDEASYFWNNLGRIGKKDFMPTKQDMLHSRKATKGIIEYVFEIDGIPFVMVDVGGARSQRTKWFQCFDEVTSILFMVSTCAYDQVIMEDRRTNCLIESAIIFESLVNNKCFANTTIILLLNKTDLLEQKVLSRHTSIKDFFKQFQGDPYNLNDVQNFILQMFDSRRRERSKPLLYHFTTAIDTENIKIVFHAVKDTILQDNLNSLILQ